MATVATQLNSGSGFASGEVVTATKLNNLVNTATIAFVTADDTDDSTLEASGGKLRIKDGGVTAAKLASGAALPAGAIMPFAMNSAPAGWLAADGSAVSRTTYASLFSAIGTTYGSGDGSTTFALPDLRGYFVRGSGTNSDATAAGTFGAKQEDAFNAHRHFTVVDGSEVSDTALTNAQSLAEKGVNTSATTLGYIMRGSTSEADIGRTSETGGTETRPKNIAMLYCIKI